MGQFKKKLTIERSLNRKRFLDYRNKKLKLLNSLNKVRANINLYHWWDEPDNVSRILDRKRFFTIINEKIQKAKARDFKDLLSKNKIDKNKISGYLYWLYRDPLRVKTGKLKKLCKYLHIPYIKIEKIIIDRDFPIDLNSEVVVKLFTHILNEGHIRLYKGKIRNILYVNQDPVLIHRVKFLIEKLGGYVFLPPPSKEAFELKSDYLTARIMNKAGIPAGSKTIADFSLHPVILNSEKLMLNHLKWTFIEEGTIGLLFDRHGFLKLYLSLSRSKDITNLFPQHIIKIFQSKYKGKSISVFSEDIPQNIRARILLSFPKVLEQETDFILKMLEKEKVKIRVSFIHISKKGNITANYSIRFASEKAVEYIAENIILKDYYGTWKEQRMKKFLKLYNEFKGVKLSPSQRNEILEIRNQYTHIPLKWALEKARSLFPSVKWLYKDEYIDKLWKRRER